MRTALPLLLLIAACSAGDDAARAFDPEAKAKQTADQQRAADAAATKAGFRPEQPRPLHTDSVDPVGASAPGVILPPATMQYRYIGRWATGAHQCGDRVWTFETRKLTTAGETRCDFPTVGAVPRGFELQGDCETAGRRTPQTLKLTFDEAAKRMRVEGKTLGPATLLYCGN